MPRVGLERRGLIYVRYPHCAPRRYVQYLCHTAYYHNTIRRDNFSSEVAAVVLIVVAYGYVVSTGQSKAKAKWLLLFNG
jgi:hypothetical protein